MKVRCSSGSFEGFSAVKNAIRLASSGRTNTISLPANPAWLKISFTADRTDAESRMLVSECEVDRRPAGKLDATVALIPLRLRSTPARMTCMDVCSQSYIDTWGFITTICYYELTFII